MLFRQMSDIFISYSKHDRSTAQALADDLTSLGASVWWDFELYAGDDFHHLILEAINAASAVIVIWSPTAGKSRWSGPRPAWQTTSASSFQRSRRQPQ